MAGKEVNKKRHNEHRKRVGKAVAHVDNHRKTGILEIPHDLPFAEFISVVHSEEARYDPNTLEQEAIGHLKHELIAKILGVNVSEDSQVASTQNLQLTPEELPENKTAYRFYRFVLNVFEPFPWEIPFSAVNALAHIVEGEDFLSARELIKEEGSERIITAATGKHVKLRDLWESYSLNRSAGINPDVYFAKHPRLPSTKTQR